MKPFISDLIQCSFQEDTCHWQEKPNNKYKWDRRTASQLDGEAGPDGDLYGERDTFFMLSLDKEGANQGDSAILISPNFIIEEHPVECFRFWFQYDVSEHFRRRTCQKIYIELRIFY